MVREIYSKNYDPHVPILSVTREIGEKLEPYLIYKDDIISEGLIRDSLDDKGDSRTRIWDIPEMCDGKLSVKEKLSRGKTHRVDAKLDYSGGARKKDLKIIRDALQSFGLERVSEEE